MILSNTCSFSFYEQFGKDISFNELLSAPLTEIIEFTKGFESSDELIEFLEEDTSNMFSPLTIFDSKNNCTYVPLYANSRENYSRVIAKNIMDIFCDDPKTPHNIDEISKLDDIAFIKYLATYPELIAIDDDAKSINKKGVNKCYHI
jgi:hypothetical protein